MSIPNSPETGPNLLSSDADQDARAAAAERRIRQAQPQKTAAQQAAMHERRQKFRRMIDPGIMRPNAHEQAVQSLKVCPTIQLTRVDT